MNLKSLYGWFTLTAGFVVCFTLMSSRAHSGPLTTAYDLTTATAGSSYVGNGIYHGTVGMEFDVNVPDIAVTSLGIFDSGLDGFHSVDGIPSVLTASIFQVGDSSPLASVSFSGTSPGTLIGYNRFKDIATLTLPQGQYIIAASGFTVNDPFGNETLPGFLPDTFNDGGGLITAEGPGLYANLDEGVGVYPDHQLDSDPLDTLAYNAGTFQYSSSYSVSSDVPEPGAWAMLITGASVGLVAVRRRNKK